MFRHRRNCPKSTGRTPIPTPLCEWKLQAKTAPADGTCAAFASFGTTVRQLNGNPNSNT
jgi:hypothetical protein